MRVLLFLTFFFVSINFTRGQEELNESQKLYATAKVWGFLKYYHPTVAKGTFKWDEQLFQILQKVRQAQTKQQVSNVFIRWIELLGTVERCSRCNSKLKKNYFDKNFDLSWIDDGKIFTYDLSKTLRFIEENRSLKENAYVETIGKAGNVEPKNEKIPDDFKWTNKNHRLLALFRYWNFIEYFFPYKYLTDENWNDVLKEMIGRFLSVESELDYNLAMLELVVKLDDSHAGLNTQLLKDYFGVKYIPVIHKIIEGQTVVTGIFNDSLARINDLAIGDIISKVNGKKTEDVLSEGEVYFQGSNRTAKAAYGWNKIFNGSTDSVELEIFRDNRLIKKKIGRYLFDDFQYKRSKKDSWRMLEGNIGYINMASFKVDHLPAIIDSLMRTNALIIDIRNYPSDYIFGYFDFLFPAGKRTFFKSIVPDLTYPGKFVWTDGDIFKFDRKPKYKGQVVILVNERTISMAEFTAMYLQSAENSFTIGSQTLAADGNVSSLEILGGYKTGMTGIGIYYPDGTQTQRTGIKIDEIVRPTIQSVAKGEDFVLNRAIEIINQR